MEMRTPQVDARPKNMFEHLKGGHHQESEKGDKHQWDCKPEAVGTRYHFFFLSEPTILQCVASAKSTDGKPSGIIANEMELSRKFVGREDYL
jgi:hypothetical protein